MANNGKKFALGAIVAAGVGYIAGILTAPKSGKETRTDIKNAAVELKKQAEIKLKTLNTELADALALAKVQLDKLSGKAKAELEEAMQMAQNAKQKAREVLSAVHEGEADDKDLEKAVKQATSALESLKKYIKKPAA